MMHNRIFAVPKQKNIFHNLAFDFLGLYSLCGSLHFSESQLFARRPPWNPVLPVFSPGMSLSKMGRSFRTDFRKRTTSLPTVPRCPGSHVVHPSRNGPPAQAAQGQLLRTAVTYGAACRVAAEVHDWDPEVGGSSPGATSIRSTNLLGPWARPLTPHRSRGDWSPALSNQLYVALGKSVS